MKILSRIQEVIKTLVESGINIDVKLAILKTLDNNCDLINSVKINPEYSFTEFKVLLEIQVREYCIIEICSFIDEYEHFFNQKYVEEEYSSKILELRKFLKPFFKEINCNYNLKEYRNHILAHNHRINSKSILMGDVIKIYQFPKSTSEFLSLKIIIDLILRVIIKEFRANLEKDLFDDKVIMSGKIKFDRGEKKFNIKKLADLYYSK